MACVCVRAVVRLCLPALCSRAGRARHAGSAWCTATSVNVACTLLQCQPSRFAALRHRSLPYPLVSLALTPLANHAPCGVAVVVLHRMTLRTTATPRRTKPTKTRKTMGPPLNASRRRTRTRWRVHPCSARAESTWRTCRRSRCSRTTAPGGCARSRGRRGYVRI